MIGKIISGVLGAQAAKNTQVGGAGGALLGVAGATLLRRLSLPALIALTAGGYAFKKWSDKQEATPAPKRTASKRKARNVTPKAANAA
jgi:hypothetical protein